MSILLLTLWTSCNMDAGDALGKQVLEVEPARATQAAGDIQASNLPCFGCHEYKRFKSRDVFPHEGHREMGLHCNQCHIIKVHQSIALNGNTCGNCHNLSMIELSLTEMPVVFNHKIHAAIFECKDCHNKLFSMKAGSNKIIMDSIYSGNACGACHNGKTAFPADECSLCHKQM